ncbi:17-beta-hydroxysteroid dehydrogenase 14 [Pseudolycoriella hygida]|uniref:17-beta-hydroxysteroid dehydrogenase 14 n=1 Tax=Pseudolycoriella hygida TaxID=35572 RepID=A0A9Q0S6C4_9DIPT|nr:17-beta-hydroxysteroid dehydrogenase 14 [Pseudolycoriella hygida]
MSVSFDFKGKSVIITGSISGIGAETAKQFTKFGANVVITGRNASKVSEVAQMCRTISTMSETKTEILEVVADVTNENDMRRLVNETISAFGKIDILVNNAGEGLRAPITDPEILTKFRKTMDINLMSVVLLTHLCVEHLEKTKGNIINISSVAALRNSLHATTYNVAKCALDMFSNCMALELGAKGIRVNVINPGVIKTNFLVARGIDPSNVKDVQEGYASKLPLGRVGESEEIANAILFLASDASSFTTGTNLVVDGGHVVGNVS